MKKENMKEAKRFIDENECVKKSFFRQPIITFLNEYNNKIIIAKSPQNIENKYENNMKIIQELQSIQKETGKTSYQIAKETGLSKNNVYELLDNKNLNPKLSTLNKVGKILGVELKWTKI